MTTLDRASWLRRRDAHHARVDAAVGDHLDRSRRGVGHPVDDFLFTYYHTRPAVLRRWHPGLGVVLDGVRSEADDPDPYTARGSGFTLDPVAVFARRAEGVAWIHRLLTATSARPPRFGCFGLHEWAMVYRTDQVRHPGLGLRVSPAEIADLVEGGVRCTHFDAYRFFTPAAAPLNLTVLDRAHQVDHDQPGCLHAGMDLYKWAGKLSPAIPSELQMDCFELARELRRVDMRASPYDVTPLGLVPIEVETPAGRAAYVEAQRELAARAAPLRAALLEAAAQLVGILDAVPPAASAAAHSGRSAAPD